MIDPESEPREPSMLDFAFYSSIALPLFPTAVLATIMVGAGGLRYIDPSLAEPAHYPHSEITDPAIMGVCAVIIWAFLYTARKTYTTGKAVLSK